MALLFDEVPLENTGKAPKVKQKTFSIAPALLQDSISEHFKECCCRLELDMIQSIILRFHPLDQLVRANKGSLMFGV